MPSLPSPPSTCPPQTCREEHKKKHPNDTVVFADFSKKCSERWKVMSEKEKQRFNTLADKVSDRSTSAEFE